MADTLFLLGRWPEARAVSRARDELAAGRGRLPRRPSSQLAIVEIETDAGEAASRLLGQTILEFDAVREPQLAGPYYLAAASFALWRGDVADASRSVDRGWASVRATEEWLLVARMAAMVAQVDAATAAEARQNRQLAPLAAARERTRRGARRGEPSSCAPSGAPMTAGSRRVAEASLATARAYQRRLEGDDDAAAWRRVALGWAALEAPYDAALARWRQAEAMLAAGEPGARAGRAPRHRCWRRSSSALQARREAAAARAARARRAGPDRASRRGRRSASTGGRDRRRGRAGRRADGRPPSPIDDERPVGPRARDRRRSAATAPRGPTPSG